MKKTAFIICEYNPFHNGHLRHLRETREAGAQTVICIMSGNFVQRGELAFCDKALRAKMAILNGADLVFELPLPYVLSGAHAFAEGAAKVVEALCGEGTLSYGSGFGEKEISSLADLIYSRDVQEEVKAICAAEYITFPRALNRVLEARMPGTDLSLLQDPNAILALEYHNVFSNRLPGVDFFAVSRDLSVPHDGAQTSGSVASAKYIRGLFENDSALHAAEQAARFIPATAAAVLKDGIRDGLLPLGKAAFSTAAMTKLLDMDAVELAGINGVRQGLEHKILFETQRNQTLQALFDSVKSKRFTHAGIRQIVLSAVLDIRKTDLKAELPYLRVLGMNQTGRLFLRSVKKNAACPVIMNLSEAPLCRLRNLDQRAGKLVELCRPVKRANNGEYQVKPFVLD